MVLFNPLPHIYYAHIHPHTHLLHVLVRIHQTSFRSERASILHSKTKRNDRTRLRSYCNDPRVSDDESSESGFKNCDHSQSSLLLFLRHARSVRIKPPGTVSASACPVSCHSIDILAFLHTHMMGFSSSPPSYLPDSYQIITSNPNLRILMTVAMTV